MKNYVIINGTNSNTLTGLMINELPPITKPEMRTQVEEIDGRDGDIITKLGYSAYDKTITIGLWGTSYDVDNIIKFFNKEGTIVFSNEPDKYYNFTQVNGFDIERLLKFKTASITFHCQPFKYPIIETQKIIQPTILTSDGESITINNTASDSLKLSLKGNTSQTGTPTPTSPIPVSVVSGDNDVHIISKNLFIGGGTTEHNGIKFTKNSDGSYNIKGTASANANDMNYVMLGECGLVNGESYVLSTNKSASGLEVRVELYNNNTWIRSLVTSATQTAVTYDLSGGNRIRFGIFVTNGTSIDITDYKIQLENNNTKTDYVPYTNQKYEVDLPVGLELCKIGTYQDYLYKDNGKWYKHSEIRKVVLNGGEDGWIALGMANCVGYYRAFANVLMPSSAGIVGNGITNYFSIASPSSNWTTPVGTPSFCINNTGNNIRFSFGETTNDLAGFKTWLSTHNTTLYYVLATPIETEITDTNLIEQLDNLSNAMSYDGTTNIGQVNNDKPFIISAGAVQSGTNEITINNIGNVYSKPLIALEGSGNVDIYLDDTQILKANVESKMNIDIAQLEAYNPDTMTLLNRQVIGNYNSMTFQPGNNKLTINGSLSKATITNYTRYL